MKKRGFTILELAFVFVFATLLVVLFFIQKINTDAMHRDEQRKEAIDFVGLDLSTTNGYQHSLPNILASITTSLSSPIT